jgi:poly-beta-1,6-N-acetyl-D-glucosamine synthase
VDMHYTPSISILVPVHNEQSTVVSKLANLSEVEYPRDKMEVILIDDASTDSTLAEVKRFVESRPDFPIKIIKEDRRAGKARALNKGLRSVSNEVVVVTDADALWNKRILQKALPYLSDSTIGAISGRGAAANPDASWVSKGEASYLDFMFTIRLGESKIHSTIRFEGSFCAFKKDAFDQFDSKSGADDSGTALAVVQNNFRSILVPEIVIPNETPNELAARIKTKIRRAIQLNSLWFHCLRLIVENRLVLPKRVALPEIFMTIVNPFIFAILAPVTVIAMLLYPLLLLSLLSLFTVLYLIPRTRNHLTHAFLDQIILLYSVIVYLGKGTVLQWE